MRVGKGWYRRVGVRVGKGRYRWVRVRVGKGLAARSTSTCTCTPRTRGSAAKYLSVDGHFAREPRRRRRRIHLRRHPRDCSLLHIALSAETCPKQTNKKTKNGRLWWAMTHELVAAPQMMNSTHHACPGSSRSACLYLT